MQRHRDGEFISFPNAVEAAVPAGKIVHLILDNHDVNKHPKCLPRARSWASASLTRHPRWTFHVTPKVAKAGAKDFKGSRGKALRTVTVRVQIAADGFMDRAEVERRSGSSDLDDRVRWLVRAANPFPSASGPTADRGRYDRTQLSSSARPPISHEARPDSDPRRRSNQQRLEPLQFMKLPQGGRRSTTYFGFRQGAERFGVNSIIWRRGG